MSCFLQEARKRAEEERRLAEKRRQEEERRLAEDRRREEERKLEEERERQKAEEVAAFLAGQQVGEEIAKDGLESGLGQTGMESGQAVVSAASDSVPMAANIANDSIQQQLQAITVGETCTVSDAETPTDSPVPSTRESQPSDDTELTATDPTLAQVLPPIPPGQVASPYLPATPPTSRPGYAAQLSHPQLPSTLAAHSYDSIFQAPAASSQASFQHQQSHPAIGAPYGGVGYYQQPPPYGYGGGPSPQQQYGGEWGYQPGATAVQQYQPEGEYP